MTFSNKLPRKFAKINFPKKNTNIHFLTLKRKAKSDGASIRAFSRSSDNENHESVTEKSGVNAYSSTFPPASLSKGDQQEQKKEILILFYL